jgi:hypothetical protein
MGILVKLSVPEQHGSSALVRRVSVTRSFFRLTAIGLFIWLTLGLLIGFLLNDVVRGFERYNGTQAERRITEYMSVGSCGCSIIGSISVMYIYVRNRARNGANLEQRLLVFLSIADLTLSVIMPMAVIVVHAEFCQLTALFMEFASLSSVLWCYVIAFNVLVVISSPVATNTRMDSKHIQVRQHTESAYCSYPS